MFLVWVEVSNPPFRRVSGGMANRSLKIDKIKSLLREVRAQRRRGCCELRGRAASCGANETYERQVFSAVKKGDLQVKPRAGTSPHQSPRPRARRAARPFRARFEVRLSVRRERAVVHFVRRPAAKPSMWPMGVVPVDSSRPFRYAGR